MTLPPEQLPEVFDAPAFIAQLEPPKQLLSRASSMAAEYYADGYRKLVFVGCGAPYRMTHILTSWIDLAIPSDVVRTYLPADFINYDPAFVDDQTIVILGSYSGTTKETVEAAEFCQAKSCLSLAMTRFDDSPLSTAADQQLNFGDTQLGDYSRFLLSTAFASSFLQQVNPKHWTYHQQIMEALHQLPVLLAAVVAESEPKIQKFSEQYATHKSLFVVGHGPQYDTAYVLAFCSFMEMQKIHATPIIGAEFFHGPFELIDDDLPVIVLIGEDPTRPQGLRIKRFCENYVEQYEIFDSHDYDLPGIADAVRGLFGPVVLDAATRRLMDYFASIRDYDKSQRRYMGVVDY